MTDRHGIDPFVSAAQCAEPGVMIKGRSPRLLYPFTFPGIYTTTPPLHMSGAMAFTRHEIERFRKAGNLPIAGFNHADLLALLLSPVPEVANGKPATRTILTSPKASALQLARAGADKISHSLTWIDVNIKLRVEDICTAASLPDRTALYAAESAELIYASLLKADTYALAGLITFNESAFVQERVVDLLFGQMAEVFGRMHEIRANELNAAASLVADGSAPGDLTTLLIESVLSGQAIANAVRLGGLGAEDGQNLYTHRLDRSLAEPPAFERSTFQHFVDRLQSKYARVGWFFDDNGETVFDLRFLDRAVRDTTVRFVLFANTLAVSENTTFEQLRTLIESGSFTHLEAALHAERVTLIAEAQHLAAMERTWLSHRAETALRSLDFILFKGANLYETFQDSQLDAYYGFVVAGPNSQRITGQPFGTPLLIYSPQGETSH